MIDINIIQNYKLQLKNIDSQLDNLNMPNYGNILSNIGIQILNLGNQMIYNLMKMHLFEIDYLNLLQQIQNIENQTKNIEIEINNNINMKNNQMNIMNMQMNQINNNILLKMILIFQYK